MVEKHSFCVLLFRKEIAMYYTILADDNAVVRRLIESRMFLNEFAFYGGVKKGTENTIQFLFYDSISYSPKWI